MKTKDFLKRQGKVKISGAKSKEIISRLVRNEFDKKGQTLENAENLLMTAYMWSLPCLDSMMDDFEIENFNAF